MKMGTLFMILGFFSSTIGGWMLCRGHYKDKIEAPYHPVSGIYFVKKHMIDFDFKRPEKEWFIVSDWDGNLTITNVVVDGKYFPPGIKYSQPDTTESK